MVSLAKAPLTSEEEKMHWTVYLKTRRTAGGEKGGDDKDGKSVMRGLSIFVMSAEKQQMR